MAVRSANIDLHRAWSGAEARMILVAGLPYPVIDGALQRLPGVHDGLIEPGEYASLRATAAGAFSGPDDGWLILSTDPGMPGYVGLPLAYQWRAPGWTLLRARQGRFTELPTDFLTRGSTVFAQVEHARLDRADQILADTLEGVKQGAPPPGLVRLRGTLPAPAFVESPEPFHQSDWVTTADGHLYRTNYLANPDGVHYRVELLDWAPDQSSARATPLPGADATLAPTYAARLRVATTDDGVLIFGNLRPVESSPSIPYLAVGQVGALTQIPLEPNDEPHAWGLSAAAPGPDGEYWLAIDGALHALDAHGHVSPLPAPSLGELEPLDLREWVWAYDGGWTPTHTDTPEELQEREPFVDDIVRVGADMWLRVRFRHMIADDLVAVFKTGSASAPVVLPGREHLLGEIRRHAHPWIELRLLAGADQAQIERFVTTTLPLLRSRAEILQIYEVDGDDKEHDVIALVEPRAWNDELSFSLSASFANDSTSTHKP